MLLSLLIVLAMGIGLALLAWKASTALPVVYRVFTRSFWCPFRNQRVDAEFQEDPWSGRAVDVSRCSAFAPSSAITCDKACVARSGGAR
jgi:hypothetical protein